MQLQSQLHHKRQFPEGARNRCLQQSADASVQLLFGTPQRGQKAQDLYNKNDIERLQEAYQQTRTYIESEQLSVCVRNIQHAHYLLFRHHYTHAGEWRDESSPHREPAPDKRFSADAWVFFEPAALPGNVYALVALYKRVIDVLKVEPSIAAPLFVLDFLCISPFVEGNGLVARLLLQWLLWRSGHSVLQVASLEQRMLDSVQNYECALSLSIDGWQEGNHNPMPWLEYCWELLTHCYQAQGLDNRWDSQLIATRHGEKSLQVIQHIDQLDGVFTLSDIHTALPHVSRETIKLVVREMRSQGKVRCLGRGRGAAWRRITQEVA